MWINVVLILNNWLESRNSTASLVAKGTLMSNWNKAGAVKSPVKFGLAIGASVGVAIGIIIQNVLLGVIFGLAVGVVFGFSLKKKQKEDKG